MGGRHKYNGDSTNAKILFNRALLWHVHVCMCSIPTLCCVERIASQNFSQNKRGEFRQIKLIDVVSTELPQEILHCISYPGNITACIIDSLQ